jgi:hypothetical protein
MFGRFHNQRWGRERDAHAPLKEQRFECVGHAAMHHWAVPVPLNEGMQGLLGAAPLDLATLLAADRPARKTIEDSHGLRGLLMLLKIHKAIPEPDRLLEIKRYVNEVVQTAKAKVIQNPAELIVRAPLRQVLHNESRAAIKGSCELLSGCFWEKPCSCRPQWKRW